MLAMPFASPVFAVGPEADLYSLYARELHLQSTFVERPDLEGAELGLPRAVDLRGANSLRLGADLLWADAQGTQQGDAGQSLHHRVPPIPIGHCNHEASMKIGRKKASAQLVSRWDGRLPTSVTHCRIHRLHKLLAPRARLTQRHDVHCVRDAPMLRTGRGGVQFLAVDGTDD